MRRACVPRDVTRLLLSLLVLLGACGDPQHPRHYPRWVVEPAAVDIQWRDCVGVRAFVRRSGKQGIGVTLEVRSRTDCAVTIAAATVVLEDGTRAAGELPALDGLRGRSLAYLWMPVRFDGDRAWNRGSRRGQLELTLALGGVAQPPITFPMVVLWDGGWGPS
jgi:hypothetical protein